MSAWIRASKVRHVHGTVSTPENSYSELSPYIPVGDSNLLSCSSTHFAFLRSDKNISVVPLSNTGKLGGAVLPTFQHTSAVEAFQFSPHKNEHLVSLTNSGTVSLYSTDTDSTNHRPISSFESSITKATTLTHHPSAASIAAVGGASSLSIVDLEASSVALTDSSYADAVTSASWSYDGSTLYTSCKDNSVKIYDPRAATASATALPTPHKGTKPPQVLALGNTSSILTVGTSMMREREFGLWDVRKLSKVLQRERMGTSNGLMTPLFDVDTSLLFLAGKGDSNVRIYELSANQLHPVQNLSPGGLPQRSVCFAPKRSLDIMDVEVAKILKLTDKGVEKIPFKIPRRDKHKFCEELFPPSAAYESAMDAKSYLEGKNANPFLSSVDPSAAAGAKKEETVEEAEQEEVPRTSSVGSSNSANRFNNGASKFRHVHGKSLPMSGRYFNLQPNISTMDGSLLAANEKFFALPWMGGGGQVYVSPLGRTGKVEPNCPLLNTGHTKAVTALSFSKFDSSILATGSDDCNVRIFGVTEEGTSTGMGDDQLIGELKGHRNGIRTLDWHPTCQNVMMTSSLDTAVKIWDVQNFKEITDLGHHHPETINNCSWNFDGSLIATGSRDKFVRILDPRTNEEVHSGKAHAGARGPRVHFCGRRGEDQEVLLTLGTGISGDRQMCLYDHRNLAKPYCTKTIDNGNGVLFPLFEESTGMVYLAGRGDRNVKYYEIGKTEEGNWDAKLCHEFSFDGDPLIGISPLPQTTVDVTSVEVLKVLRLSSSEVQPASFFLPRNADLKEFFQDDVYGDVRSSSNPAVEVSDWADGHNGEMFYDSLRPKNMPLLSERKVVRTSRSKTQAFRQEIEFKEKEDVQKNDMFLKMQAMAVTHEQYNPNKSSGNVVTTASNGVDCTPIYDSDSDGGWSDDD
ncbi:hypothetical protein TrVE_jg5731 [Triparma verrucosa]|uniref:Coronin n=1 Tax=Triparma verrucosa TaxID=1606542 RepID=A0A9W7DRV5_9STRA|nr:hypothetical protein TrVE_jg5731 [Triparma verrucosa]